MKNPVYVVKLDGTREAFDKVKLKESLTHAGGNADLIEKIVSHITEDMEDDMTTTEIYSHAFELLRQHSVPVATRYSLRRALAQLGPDGFPFEKFVAEIFKAWGYETLTDQILLGACVSHEVDVVAWNPEKLIILEAKFHNEYFLKSDVKVALYVKARFDDIKETLFDYGGTKRHVDECWIMTNTKFTEQAIKYGTCNGLHMIGWNYPETGNLHDIIEGLHLHPFTALATLSSNEKKALLSLGIVLCKDITPDVLAHANVPKNKIDEVMAEVKMVCGQ